MVSNKNIDRFCTNLWNIAGRPYPKHSFPCDNNKCIPDSKVCDGIVHCNDNADETSICDGNKL